MMGRPRAPVIRLVNHFSRQYPARCGNVGAGFFVTGREKFRNISGFFLPLIRKIFSARNKKISRGTVRWECVGPGKNYGNEADRTSVVLLKIRLAIRPGGREEYISILRRASGSAFFSTSGGPTTRTR